MAQSAAAELVAAGADGIVTGVLTPEGDLDVEALQPIYAAARACGPKRQAARWPAPSTAPLTSAGTPLPRWKLPERCGLSTILTSGQAASAPEGAALLRRLVEAAGPEHGDPCGGRRDPRKPARPLPPPPGPGPSISQASRCWTAG